MGVVSLPPPVRSTGGKRASAPRRPQQSGRTRSASRRAEADDEFRRACQGCCVTRPARRAPSLPPFRTGSPALPVSGRLSPQAPLPPRSVAHPASPADGSCSVPGPGRWTDKGHGERRRQVSAKLRAPGPRAGRTGPGVLPLSAGGLCVRVPGPHHPPLGPGQVSASSLQPHTPGPCCKLLPTACGRRVSLPYSVLSSPFLPGPHSGLRSLPIPRALALWARSVRNRYDFVERAPDWGNRDLLSCPT